MNRWRFLRFSAAPESRNKRKVIIKTFLDEYNLSGKAIIPFNTHEGSRDGGTYRYIAQQEPNATVLDGLPIRGRDMQNDQTQTVCEWLDRIGY